VIGASPSMSSLAPCPSRDHPRLLAGALESGDAAWHGIVAHLESCAGSEGRLSATLVIRAVREIEVRISSRT
jgi:hypothetical protein